MGSGGIMIDPFTAFAIAQGAVAGIKKAVALGKDIQGLYKEFSSFYHAADEVHAASSKMRVESIGKSNAQINAESLKIAMASKALRENERELKNILFWSGNASVWEEMMAERTRMIKERNEMERFQAEQKQKDREAKAKMIMVSMYLIGALAIVIPLITILFNLIVYRKPF